MEKEVSAIAAKASIFFIGQILLLVKIEENAVVANFGRGLPFCCQCANCESKKIHIVENIYYLKARKYLDPNHLKARDMKNITTALLFAVTFSISMLGNAQYAHAQGVPKGSSNFFLGYGAPNLPALFVGAFSGTGAKGHGPYTLTYQYGIAKNFALGFQVGYVDGVSNPIEWEESYGGYSSTLHYTLNMSILTVMAKSDYHYTKNKRNDFYSGVAVGYGIISFGITGHDDPTRESFKFSALLYSVTAFGYRHMFTDNIGVFNELGYGVMGFETFGASFRFGSKPRSEWWKK